MITTEASHSERTRADVENYYGRVLQHKQDLQTNACCDSESIPRAYRHLVADIHPEILDKFYGCGSPLPYALEGRTVLDLGCGTGRDVYLLSRLVGPEGRVIGVDMTEAQLAVARKHREYHMAHYGYAQANVDFRRGLIEDLRALDIDDESVDVVVSNCVINLSPDKQAVFSEIFRVLKPGGELFFSDVLAGRRVPEDLAADPVLRGECLGGAMYREDFRRLLRGLGCNDYRIASQSPLEITNPEIEARIGMVDFTKATVRAFKLALEDLCENYGQVAYYRGTLPEAPHAFKLDDHHLFKTGMPVPVCGNTAAMLTETRYADHFQVIGDTSVHYGPFDCTAPAAAEPADSGPCC